LDKFYIVANVIKSIFENGLPMNQWWDDWRCP